MLVIATTAIICITAVMCCTIVVNGKKDSAIADKVTEKLMDRYMEDKDV